jgi:hypothetical protein
MKYFINARISSLSLFMFVFLFSQSVWAADVFVCTDKKARKQNIQSVVVDPQDNYCRCPRSARGETDPAVKKVNKKSDCKSPCYLADNKNSTDRCQIASDVVDSYWAGYTCPQGCSELRWESSSEPTRDERAAGKKAKASCQFIKEAICEPKLANEDSDSAH